MKVLLLGYSSIAKRRIIPALENLSIIESIDIGSKSITNRETVSFSKFSNTFNSYSEALEKSNAEIVYISTVNSLHEELALSALDSGRHVIVDKPAFLTLAATERVLRAAKSKGLGVAESTVFTFHPQFVKLRLLADQYGPIERIVATFTMPPFPKTNYRWLPTLGGGALHDLSPYVAATARYFFGAKPIFLSVQTLKRDHETGVDVAFSVLIDFGKGQSLVGIFGFDTEYINSLMIFGANCCLKIERPFSAPLDLKNKIELRHKNQITNYLCDTGDSFGIMLNDILSLFASGKPDKLTNWILEDAQLREKIYNCASEKDKS